MCLLLLIVCVCSAVHYYTPYCVFPWCAMYTFSVVCVRMVQCIHLLCFIACGAVHTFTVDFFLLWCIRVPFIVSVWYSAYVYCCFRVVRFILLLLIVSVCCRVYFYCWLFPCGTEHTFTVECSVWCSAFPCGELHTFSVFVLVWCNVLTVDLRLPLIVSVWYGAYFYWLMFLCDVVHTFAFYCFHVVQCILLLLFPCGGVHSSTTDFSPVWQSACCYRCSLVV